MTHSKYVATRRSVNGEVEVDEGIVVLAEGPNIIVVIHKV